MDRERPLLAGWQLAPPRNVKQYSNRAVLRTRRRPGAEHRRAVHSSVVVTLAAVDHFAHVVPPWLRPRMRERSLDAILRRCSGGRRGWRGRDEWSHQLADAVIATTLHHRGDVGEILDVRERVTVHERQVSALAALDRAEILCAVVHA